MQQLAQRVVFGLLYVMLVIGSVQFDFTFVLLIASLGVILIAEFARIVQIKLIWPLTYFLVALIGLYFVDYQEGWSDYRILLNCIVGTAILSHLFLLHKLYSGKPYTLLNFHGIFYVVHGILSLLILSIVKGQFDTNLILSFFVFIWVCDSGAYAAGNLVKGRKLMPSVSPKKTISGFLGGVILAGITGWLVSCYSPFLNSLQWIIFSTSIAVVASVGDLIESKFKRLAGLKDSGKIMPGHGGVYDRLDGVIFAAPWAYIIFKIVSYVS